MKKYDVVLKGNYEKTIAVYANSPEQAAEKVKIMLFDTDLIGFSDEDFVCGEADIKEADVEMTDAEEDDCSGCENCCPVCGVCMYACDC